VGAGHTHTLYVHEHSRVHRLAPEAKLLAAFTFVLTVALTPRTALWAFALDALLLVGVVRVARVPLGFVATRLVVVVPFVLFALALPVIGTGERVAVLGLSLSVDGLWACANILAKAGLGAATSILLAATTEIPDLLRGFERLRVPAVLTAIAMFMVRYLEVVTGEVRRMRTAMTARGYDPRWLAQAKPIAAGAGALFIRSYERGERVHDAMLARGYTGAMPDLGHRRADAGDWQAALLLPAGAVLVTIAAHLLT
jgi:cobalt/nickel transport system permease protein